MKTDVTEIQINGITYIPKDDAGEAAEDLSGREYVIVRCQSAGVFAGYRDLEHDENDLSRGIVVLKNARRIWYWAGAASLSQLAVDGTSKPNECKFPAAVSSITLLQVIEVLSTTAKAQKSIQGVKVWAQ